MEMKDFVKMLKGISDGKTVLVPAQIHVRGQLNRIINAFGSAKQAYEYFRKVLEAEAPTYKEGVNRK